MIELSWALLWLVIALVCFGLCAVGIGTIRRVGLMAAGLFFLTLYFIFVGSLLHVRIGG